MTVHSSSRAAVGVPRPTIPPSRYGERLAGARRAMAEHGVDALLVGVGADLRYLTGHAALPLERLTMLVLADGAPDRLVVPRLEADPAGRSPAGAAGLVDIVPWRETQDAHALVADLLRETSLEPSRIGVSDTLWASHLLAFQAALPAARFEPGSRVTRELRMVKDPAEIELLRRAAEAADRVVGQIAAGPLVGRSEAAVAREVRDRLIAEGHDEVSFAIVASGPNSASPHHEPSDRVIGAGEPIVLDIGGTLGGYSSDITRTLWVTGGDPANGPDAAYRAIFELVREAHRAATDAVRPGVPTERLDAIARDVIAAGGHGDAFIHRLGHGIGLEGHEHPYLVEGDATELRPGMAFSIEPGIYLEGRHGVRLEDIVVAGEDGPIVLNRAPLDLLVVAG